MRDNHDNGSHLPASNSHQHHVIDVTGITFLILIAAPGGGYDCCPDEETEAQRQKVARATPLSKWKGCDSNLGSQAEA